MDDADFLRRIHAAPEDDAAREVYADWLQERGDPRGELIALQLARARSGEPATTREVDLLARHTQAWLGPAEMWVRASQFERGFLVGCAVVRLPDDDDWPGWATVEWLEHGLSPLLEFDRFGRLVAVLANARLGRVVSPIDVLDTWCARRPAIEAVVLLQSSGRGGGARAPVRELLPMLDDLPRLCQLSWPAARLPGDIVAPLENRLTTRLTRYLVTVPPWELTFERGVDGRLSELVAACAGSISYRPALRKLAGVLDRISPPLVRLRLEIGRALDASERAELRSHPTIGGDQVEVRVVDGLAR